MPSMTKREQFLRIKVRYREAHSNARATARTMLDWAAANGIYAVDQAAAMRRGAEELAAVLRSETVLDDSGEDVRVNHSYDTEQGHLWDDYRTIQHSHMELSVAQARNRIFGEIKHQAGAINLYNEYHQDRPPFRRRSTSITTSLRKGCSTPLPANLSS